MRLLVSGTRYATWEHRPVITATMLDVLTVMRARDPHTIIQGCQRGVDAIAYQVATDWGWDNDPYQADWDRLGKAAGPIRNYRMVTRGRPDAVAALPARCDGLDGGTGDLVKRAVRAGLTVLIRPLDVEKPR